MGFALSKMQLTSPAFPSGGAIPKRHSQEGENTSPPLVWSNAPEGTKAFAVICHDPDAPLVTPAGQYGYVHWVAYGIPGNATALEEAATGLTDGKNETGEVGYTGPMPPEGHGVHHYFFWLLALGQDVELEPGLDLNALLAKVEPHILGMNRLVGTYER
jgi:hypothetical protein